MEEDKKKKTTTKKTTTAKKKTTTKKASTATKSTTAKKVAPKKTATKKTATKKTVVEKEEVKPTPVVEETEAKLEKTIIFDGKQNKNLKEVVEKLEEENVVVEDKVVKRSKIRQVLVFILAVAMVVILAAATAYVISQRRTELKNNQTINSDIYSKVSVNNNTGKKTNDDDVEVAEEADSEKYDNIVTINLAQFESKVLKKEDMVVLVASSTCYGCIRFEPIIDEVFGEREQKVYRLDIVKMAQEDVNRFRTYYAFTVTPTLFVLKNGVVTADTGKTGYMEKEKLEEWLKENA